MGGIASTREPAYKNTALGLIFTVMGGDSEYTVQGAQLSLWAVHQNFSFLSCR